MASSPASTVKAMSSQMKHKVYYSYCPDPTNCKRTKHLGRSYTEQKARERVLNHLYASPYHYLSEEAAREASEKVQVEAVEEDWNDGDAERDANDNKVHVKRPPEPTCPPPAAKRRLQEVPPATALSREVPAKQPLGAYCQPHAAKRGLQEGHLSTALSQEDMRTTTSYVVPVLNDLTAAINQQTRNAYIFVKVSYVFSVFEICLFVSIMFGR